MTPIGGNDTEIKSAEMFVEIELGQRLGPGPGAGGIAERDEKGRILHPNPHADLGMGSIPQPRVSETRG